MADRKDSKTPSKSGLMKKKEKKVDKAEGKPEKEKNKDKDEKMKKKTEQNDAVSQGNGEIAEGAKGQDKNEDFELEPMELPPFQIIVGDRMCPSFFKFQFKNVEYSSGRNKTFLCYQVDIQGAAVESEGLRGYLEDEHSGSHAEEVFFQQVLAYYDKSLNYTVTWYTSSSPCVSCAAKLIEILRARKTLRLNVHCSRLFQWDDPETQAGLKALVKAGCKLRMMRPVDFSYVWSTFVENEEDNFTPWEDCQDSYDYYDEKLQDILK
ncbi:hypothetical protein DNTS_033467 [Danionella cerebrum]|uniref:CMP/dCMP-type deaminase domain-containing protein n=1 Tax=Danionella cerebrum TaxID=2873325 RepID=A0A553R254_9TELE|nr:hypothetical protein DNTS_033467 [Danionella translucida]